MTGVYFAATWIMLATIGYRVGVPIQVTGAISLAVAAFAVMAMLR
jgi:hypothetical protein